MIKSIIYNTKGTCSRQILLELEDGRVKKVSFVGGCSGNTKGIAKLVVGMDAKEVSALLKGTDCGGKGTSCPDQLSKAIDIALSEK